MEAVEPCRADDVTGLILGCRAAGWKAVDGFADAARRKAETVFVFFIIMTGFVLLLFCCCLFVKEEEEELVADSICMKGKFSWPLAYLCLIGPLRRWIL